MQYVFNDKDINYIQRINSAIAAEEELPVFAPTAGREYFLQFEVADVAKANAFIMNLMNSDEYNTKYVEDTLGIRVKSFNYCSGDAKAQELKGMLQNFIDQL